MPSAGEQPCVIALTGYPSQYVAAVIGETEGATVIVMVDDPEAIVSRIRVWEGGQLVRVPLTPEEQSYYREVIERDGASFAELFREACFVDIVGCGPSEAACRVRDAVEHDARLRASKDDRAPARTV